MKRGLSILIFLSIILILSVGFVSAGWLGDFWKKITGQTIIFDDYGWTQWLDRDDPSGIGDFEDLAAHKAVNPELCANPIDIECSTLSDAAINSTGQNVTCNIREGLYCLNSNNPSGCLDYKVKFRCSTNTTNLINSTCSDSDGGINYYSVGTCTSNFSAGGPYTDSCYTNSAVREFYCVNDSSNSIYFGWPRCAEAPIYNCPSGKCVNGSCLHKTNQTNCTDTCSSLGYQCGTWSICGINQNCGICSLGYICSNGKCVSNQTNESTCFDSDGGLNYYVKGIASGYDVGGYVKAEDYCLFVPPGVIVLNEAFCSNLTGGPMYNQNPCPVNFVCQDGVCVISNRTNITSCSGAMILSNTQKVTIGEHLVSVIVISGTQVRVTVDGSEISFSNAWSTVKLSEGVYVSVKEIHYYPKINISKAYIAIGSTASACRDLATYSLNVTKRGSGSGIVTSLYEYADKINCGNNCSGIFYENATIILKGEASKGNLGTWYGCDQITFDKTCVIKMNSNKNVRVTFTCGITCLFKKIFPIRS